ncbi:MAG: DNA-directed RNA polymerase subunit alpha [Chlamydiae bacterium]|nr:DNA-directed RNA polymerase subunit alpha [Chlamydiota bacterium]
MSVRYGKFEMPEKIELEENTATDTFARFVAEPFERGFGHTLGNSMRRLMLTALEAPAIIACRLEGVPHEYMAIDGIVEDMTNIILNLKGALLRKLPMDETVNSREQRILTKVLEITQDDLNNNNGQVEIKFGDIIDEGSFDIVNPNLHLFTVTKPMKKQIDLRVAFGKGYVPSERHDVSDKTADEILIDAAFSPVHLVHYFVENTRVGQDTDFDRLVLEVTTDGRITPTEAIGFAAQIALKHFDVFNKIETHTLAFEEVQEEGDGDKDEIMEKLSLRIDEIELSVRSTNCLSGANIETIAELVSIPERRMLEFRNFGKKSLNEIKAKLHEMGLSLGMDLTKYGITLDNVKEKVQEYQEMHPKAEFPITNEE